MTPPSPFPPTGERDYFCVDADGRNHTNDMTTDEHECGWTLVDALYFSVVTVSTVGCARNGAFGAAFYISPTTNTYTSSPSRARNALRGAALPMSPP